MRKDRGAANAAGGNDLLLLPGQFRKHENSGDNTDADEERGTEPIRANQTACMLPAECGYQLPKQLC